MPGRSTSNVFRSREFTPTISGARGERPPDLGLVVRFHEDREAAGPRGRVQAREGRVVESGDDEEHGVGAEGSREIELDLVHDEVLHEDRQPRRRLRARQPGGIAAEEVLLDDDRQRRCPAAPIGARDGFDAGSRVGKDQARARRAVFDFGKKERKRRRKRKILLRKGR